MNLSAFRIVYIFIFSSLLGGFAFSQTSANAIGKLNLPGTGTLSGRRLQKKENKIQYRGLPFIFPI